MRRRALTAGVGRLLGNKDLGRSVLGNAIDVAAVMRLLGQGNENPTTARRHRSTLASAHVFESGARWVWKGQPRSHDAIAGLMFADVPMRVRGEDSDEIIAPGEAAFLHPYRAVGVEALQRGAGVCI